MKTTLSIAACLSLMCTLSAALAERSMGSPSPNPRTGLSPGITARLSRAGWVPVGSTAPARVIYVFTDPECPYCNVLWNDLQHADLSAVQVRHLVVAVVTPQSRDAAAAILEASDPARALAAHERQYRKQAVAPHPMRNSATRETLAVNASLMDSLGIYATPAIVYDDEDGRVSVFSGVPSAAQLQKILRPLTPAAEASPARAAQSSEIRPVP